jgi:hypothetical protein
MRSENYRPAIKKEDSDAKEVARGQIIDNRVDARTSATLSEGDCTGRQEDRSAL